MQQIPSCMYIYGEQGYKFPWAQQTITKYLLSSRRRRHILQRSSINLLTHCFQTLSAGFCYLVFKISRTDGCSIGTRLDLLHVRCSRVRKRALEVAGAYHVNEEPLMFFPYFLFEFKHLVGQPIQTPMQTTDQSSYPTEFFTFLQPELLLLLLFLFPWPITDYMQEISSGLA